MKKIYMLIALAAFSYGASAQQSLMNLVGKWESADGTGLEIVDSTQIYICYGKDKKKISSYQIDFSKKPCFFDFELKDSTETLALKSLFLFINEDLLQWQLFENARPANFSTENGEMVYLRRKKEEFKH